MATVTLNDKVYERLADTAHQSGRLLNEFVDDLVSRYLVETQQKQAAPRLPAEHYLPELDLGWKQGVSLQNLDEFSENDQELDHR